MQEYKKHWHLERQIKIKYFKSKQDYKLLNF